MPQHETKRYRRGHVTRPECEQHRDDHELDGRGETTSNLQLDTRGQRNGCHEQRRQEPGDVLRLRVVSCQGCRRKHEQQRRRAVCQPLTPRQSRDDTLARGGDQFRLEINRCR